MSILSELNNDFVYDDNDPTRWEYHFRIRREKESLKYSELLAQEIYERIASGEFLINICKDEHMPSVRRCNAWLRENSDFKLLYVQSINDRLSIFEDEIITIPDEAAKDFDEIEKDGSKRKILDSTKITAAKLRVEVRCRHLKAGKPQKWGESSTLNIKNEDPLDCSNLSLDELETRIADIELKNKIVKGAA